jgi:hypothetical protein
MSQIETDIPSREPIWANNSQAQTTDAGASYYDTGFGDDDAPASSHVNWLLNQQCEYLDSLQRRFAGVTAINSLRIAQQGTFFDHGSLLKSTLVYDERSRYWYFTSGGTAGAGGVLDDVYFDSSPDGATWSYPGTPIDSAIAANYQVTRGVSNGVFCVVGCDAKAYVSTDRTATNLNLTGNSFASIAGVRDMLFVDDFNGTDPVFLAFGVNGTTGYIEKSTDGVTWTVVHSRASFKCLNVAVGGDASLAGRIIVTSESDDDLMYSDDSGATWSNSDDVLSSANYIRHIQWAPSLRRWLVIDSADNLWYSNSTLGTSYTDSGVNASHLFITDTFALYESTLSSVYEILQVSSGFVVSEPTNISSALLPHSSCNMSIFRGSRGTCFYPGENGDSMQLTGTSHNLVNL